MCAQRIGPLAQAWYRWKALRLPWRKRFLMGYDLQGNTYWEFRLTRGAAETSERWRRIVQYPRSTHYSQVKVSPQWHQWLRHTRRDPPSLGEQEGDVVRRERIKVLAAQADARWDAKPRVMEAPASEGMRLPAAEVEETPVEEESSPEQDQQRKQKQKAKVEDPWAKAKAQGPGENWQPSAWQPKSAKKR